jgi:uncharacterized protein YjbI with pentapeptide repeats
MSPSRWPLKLIVLAIASLGVLLAAAIASGELPVAPMQLGGNANSVLVGHAPVLVVSMPADANGTVGFYDDEIPGPDKGIGVAVLHNGVGLLERPTRELPVGVNHIHASYGGDSRYEANDSNMIAVTVGVECLRQEKPPEPEKGGVVFARPIRDNGPNVVVLQPGAVWLANSSCEHDDWSAAQEVMSHPRSIQIGEGSAALLKDSPANLSSAWGAKSVSFDDPPPEVFPGKPEWETTEVDAVDQKYLATTWDSCRDCLIPGISLNPSLVKPRPPSQVGYAHDFRDADLDGAKLHGVFDDWNFSGADLTDADLSQIQLRRATFDHTTVDQTNLHGADLTGAQLVSLRFSAVPNLSGITIGNDLGIKCTAFMDTNLVGTDLSVAKVVGRCDTPLLPGSAVSLTVLRGLIDSRAPVDLADTSFVSGSKDRSILAGRDLKGMNLDRAHFIGFPADFDGTNFDGDSMRRATFELSDFAGASLHNVDATGTSFRGARMDGTAKLKPANFAGSNTNLSSANFVGADVSGVSFAGADLTGAVFTRALAVDTDFDGVRAANASFNRAHIYGDGEAFNTATNLSGADFADAVLAGNVDTAGGFDLTKTDLTGAKFDGAQCISCNFAGSTLTLVNFSGAYLPGAVFSGALSLKGVNFTDAWLYCGNLTNSSCATARGGRWSWPLTLGGREAFGPVSFANTNLKGVSLSTVAACPNGQPANPQSGCDDRLLPQTGHAPTLPAACSPAGNDVCPTRTSTLFDAAKIGTPTAVVPAAPTIWSTLLPSEGYYAAFSDGTIRRIDNGTTVIAGQPGKHCAVHASPCGDGGPATKAQLGDTAGLAVGLDGSIYVADSALHRVRRIDRAGQITTVAGDGSECKTAAEDSGPSSKGCGDQELATRASLAGPYGTWVSPEGDIYIADGLRGIREVDGATGKIVSYATGGLNIHAVVGDFSGNLYALSRDPDYLIRLKLGVEHPAVEKLAGTGKDGYNGDSDAFGQLLPGTSVQVNDPQDLSITADGDIVFADTGNSLIRAYVPSSRHVINLAGLVTNGQPVAGFNGDDQWADQTALDHPLAVTVARDGLYVIADSGNRRIRQFDPDQPNG